MVSVLAQVLVQVLGKDIVVETDIIVTGEYDRPVLAARPLVDFLHQLEGGILGRFKIGGGEAGGQHRAGGCDGPGRYARLQLFHRQDVHVVIGEDQADL